MIFDFPLGAVSPVIVIARCEAPILGEASAKPPIPEPRCFELKQEFVLFAGQERANLSALCRRFGIDRKTGGKWLRCYQAEGHGILRHQKPPSPDYADMRVRKVDTCGRLRFQGYTFRIGKAFCRESIGIQEKTKDGSYSLWWYSSRIGQIDLKNHSITIGKEENTC
jgi:hypothetical protein